MTRSLAETLIRPVAYPLLGLAVTGFVTCLVFHLLAFLGGPLPSAELDRVLTIGVLVVWFPALLIGAQITSGTKRPEILQAMLRGCPKWMVHGVVGLSIYVLLCGILSSNHEANAFAIRMSFYFFGSAISYSATRVEHIGPRRCPQGHESSDSASYCDVCGQKLPPAPL
ncbi:MAG TPA: hypothetical protein VMR50_14240 [Myxococcota bacterium]|nr:hypothetical protein [Myxococcota bacterium]